MNAPPKSPRTKSELRRAAIAAHQAGALDEALAHYTRYLNNVPDDAGIWSNLGALFRTRGRSEDANRAHDRAYRLAPDGDGVRNNYANALADVGRYAEAIALRQQILTKEPDDAQQKALLGRAIRSKGDYAEAASYLRAALSEHPDDAEIELQLAFALLGAGDYGAGFEAYRSRWRSSEIKQVSLPYPRWAGEDLTGKTVLVMPEQGFGDAVLMMRFLPWLKERCAKVVCLAERPLARLFERVDGVDVIGPEIHKSDEFDCFLTLFDLPRLGLQGRGDIPAPTRLNIPEDSSERAARIAGPFKSKFRVGVVWTGSTTYKANGYRSFTHREFLPLAEVENVQLFSLYKGPMVDAYRADGSAAFILDAGSSDRDFADCAALMQAMDLVITSDTATAHIAGSLGVPTWVVLHWDPFWVYTHSGDSTPWYPQMRLFRQRMPLHWDDVFVDIKQALMDEVRGEPA